MFDFEHDGTEDIISLTGESYQVEDGELLRYTDLEIPEVTKRAGIGLANNLYLTFKREFNLAPGYRRLQIRQEGDLGRYKL